MPEIDFHQAILSRLDADSPAEALLKIVAMQNKIKVLEERVRPYPVVGRAA